MNRTVSTLGAGFVCWGLGIASILSLNLWADFAPLGFVPMLEGKTIFDLLDFFTANIMLPLGGLLVALFAGWVMSREAMEKELALSPGMFNLLADHRALCDSGGRGCGVYLQPDVTTAITDRGRPSGSPRSAFNFRSIRSSARVRPKFRVAMGLFHSLAYRQKRKPEYTINDEPITRRPSLALSVSRAEYTRSLGTKSPKNTTSGFRTPRTSDSPPAGNPRNPHPDRHRYPVPYRRYISGIQGSDPRSGRVPHPDGNGNRKVMHTTSSAWGPQAVTARVPAFWCRRSTFCNYQAAVL